LLRPLEEHDPKAGGTDTLVGMRFTQVKLATSDPKRLSRFYEEALDCVTTLSLTRLEEPAGRGAGATDGDVWILVMKVPGDEGGPTLELISGTGIDSGGGMLTFYVDDVGAVAERVVVAGGAFRGDITDFVGPSGATFRFVFMTDPEGNVIDLFSRARA
jgi:predicted enzyme related to lactoylglutathione lyase